MEKVITIFALGTQFHYGKAIVAPLNQEKDLEGPSPWLYNFKLREGSFQAPDPRVTIVSRAGGQFDIEMYGFVYSID